MKVLSSACSTRPRSAGSAATSSSSSSCIAAPSSEGAQAEGAAVEPAKGAGGQRQLHVQVELPGESHRAHRQRGDDLDQRAWRQHGTGRQPGAVDGLLQRPGRGQRMHRQRQVRVVVRRAQAEVGTGWPASRQDAGAGQRVQRERRPAQRKAGGGLRRVSGEVGRSSDRCAPRRSGTGGACAPRRARPGRGRHAVPARPLRRPVVAAAQDGHRQPGPRQPERRHTPAAALRCRRKPRDHLPERAGQAPHRRRSVAPECRPAGRAALRTP